MSSKIWFYNHWGELEDGGLPVDTTPRSWVLNGYGRCDFAIPLTDPMLQEKLIRFGNFVRIVHYPDEDESRTIYGALPEWVGMIVTPRTWNKDAVVVSAVTAEALFAFRAMPFVHVEGAPDVVFKQIVGLAISNAQNDTIPVNLGQVDVHIARNIAGTTYTDELRTNAYDHIQKLVKNFGMDWDVTAKVTPDSSALQLVVNLYNRKGGEGLVLTTVNTDNNDPLLTEQGTITNDIFAYNQAQTEATRVMQEVRIDTSIGKYGLWQVNRIYTGVTDSTGLLSAAALLSVTERGEPVRMIKRTALDYMDTFQFIAAGNTCYIYSPEVGFNSDGSLGFYAWARVLSADYNDKTKKCALNVQIDERRTDFVGPENFFV